MPKSILIVGGQARSLVNFRGPLLEAMRARGLEVHAAAPALSQDRDSLGWLKHRGIHAHDIFVQRAGINPIVELRSFLALRRLIRGVRPDIFLGYTVKPAIFGTLAAKVCGVPFRYAMITGLGYAFASREGFKRGLVQTLVRRLYRLAIGNSTGVIFQNCDDARLFSAMKITLPRTFVHVVNGSGVDLAHFRPAEIVSTREGVRFLLVARLLASKGIREYAAAAQSLKTRYPNARFLLVGGTDSNPDSLAIEEVSSWQDAHIVEWLGEVSDVREPLAYCHVFVLPSYREGTPRSVLEAMATGRPIITTDAPGCRETVVDGCNGFLVPVGNSIALARSMERFLIEEHLVSVMGAKSRKIVEDRFDSIKVSEQTLKAMDLA